MSAFIPSEPKLPREARRFVEAAGRGDNALIMEFLDKYGSGAIDMKDEIGRTALMWAAASGHKETIELLLEKNADIGPKDKEDGWTALMWAALNGRDEVVLMLLEKGASLDEKDREGMTAQMLAHSHSHPQTEELLKQWPVQQEQKKLAEQEEQHQRWLDSTDCSKGLEQSMRVPRPIKKHRP